MAHTFWVGLDYSLTDKRHVHLLSELFGFMYQMWK
jgi:hypothetical protein